MLLIRIPLMALCLFFCVGFVSPICTAVAISGTTARFERLGPFGGDIRSLLIDYYSSQTVYLGSSNGKIYKSRDAGKSWQPLSPGIEQPSYIIDDLVQHPREPEHIYAGAWDMYSEGGGLFESKDAGASWTRIKLPHEITAIRGIALCQADPDTMLVGTIEGVFLSTDAGASWIKVGGELLTKAESVAIDPRDSRTLYVGTWRLGYVSRDGGATWNRIEKGMPLDSDVFSMAIDPNQPETVFGSACSGVYRSDDGMRTWKRLRVKPDQFTIRAQVIYLDPADANRVYTGTTEGLYVSPDAGNSWKLLTSRDITVNAVQVDPEDSRRILLGTEYQGVLVSEDGGKTWQESNTGFINQRISWIDFAAETKGNFLAGVHSGGGGWYQWQAGENRWKLEQIEPGMRELSFLRLPGQAGLLAGTPQGIYHQKSLAQPWKKLPGAIALRTVYSLALDASQQVVYAGTDQGIYRAALDTLDFKVPRGNRLAPKAWKIITPPALPGTVYAGTHMGLLRSQDRGLTWKVTSAYGLPERVTIYSLVVSPDNKDHFWAGTSAGLFMSTSGGVYWQRAGGGNLGFSISDVLFIDGDATRILAADRASGGLFYSTDGGTTWERIFAADFSSPIYCLAQDPENPAVIYLGTASEGVYRLTL